MLGVHPFSLLIEYKYILQTSKRTFFNVQTAEIDQGRAQRDYWLFMGMYSGS